MDVEAVRAANRKQAMVPDGAFVLDPVGTAPGVVVPGRPTVVVLPGPPKELQAMWPAAVATDAVAQAIAARTDYRQDTVRMFGVAESGLAETLRAAEAQVAGFDALEITTCLRRGEVEMVTRYEPEGAHAYRALMDLVRDRHGAAVFSEDGSTVDEQVARLLTDRRIAFAQQHGKTDLTARRFDSRLLATGPPKFDELTIFCGVNDERLGSSRFQRVRQASDLGNRPVPLGFTIPFHDRDAVQLELREVLFGIDEGGRAGIIQRLRGGQQPIIG
jgi:hypothetical protein